MRNRRVHFDTAGHAHELTFSCFKKRTFLSDENACRYLGQSLIKAKQRFDFTLLAYVFMPDHVHILIYPREESYSISSILTTIKQSVSRRTMIRARKSDRSAMHQYETGLKSKPYRFWQDGGGYDRNIVNGQVLKKIIDYIHNNPVRKDLVASPEEWRWSSYRDWHGLTRGPILVDIDCFPFT